MRNTPLGKAPGPDGISPRELKFASGDICNSLSVLFNESLASGEMPDDFKHGLLRPIFKPDKTDSQQAANYRGITLNSILSKVLERIVHSQLCDHLKLTKSISCGFSVWFPHWPLLLRSVGDNKMQLTIGSWLGTRSWTRLSCFLICQWRLTMCAMRCFCCGCSKLVLVARFWNGCTTSSPKRVLEITFSGKVQPDSGMHTHFVSNIGVSQGAVLGPLLSNLYVSDLEDVARANGATLPSFADNFTLFCSRKTMDEAVDDASLALQVVSTALDQKGLSMSEEKTVSVLIPASPSFKCCI